MRYSKYIDKHCETIINLGKRGASITQMAAKLDVSVDGLKYWLGKYPEFREAYDKARTYSQAWWEDQGQAGLREKGFNAGVFNKLISCRFPHDYTERKEIKSENKTDLTTGGEKLNNYDVEDLKRFLADKEKNSDADS